MARTVNLAGRKRGCKKNKGITDVSVLMVKVSQKKPTNDVVTYVVLDV